MWKMNMIYTSRGQKSLKTGCTDGIGYSRKKKLERPIISCNEERAHNYKNVNISQS